MTFPSPASPIQPGDCGSGGGGSAVDAEQLLLCDTLPDGTVVGTALAVYDYTAAGAPDGPPTFVDPTTGLPYVPQGTLMPCPGEVGCLDPVQFCFTSTSTGPVEHPGRQYDLDLPVNPGFGVDSLSVDATTYPANITWGVTDPDGEQFKADLQAFLNPRFPGQTVTITNPNAGTPVCGIATPMHIHIECIRVDAPAPAVVSLQYNGGRDLVVNPGYLTTPPTNLDGPQFVYLQRQDAGGTLNCTNTANRGWETNDLGGNAQRDFELWGQGPGGLQTTQNTTPTPRGTPVQEITADINDTGAHPTIWQTFVVPVAGNVHVQLVHGARDAGEVHKITLSTGDDNDNQTGDIINNVTTPPQVTNAGGGTPGPWTTFDQVVALGAGTYTFAISTTNPVGANRGGAFTDMRVILDAPGQVATATNDDTTCTISTTETTTTTECQFWAPECSNGDIVSWKNVETGAVLSNAAFWAQVPSPECCIAAPASGGGGSVSAGNLVNFYQVCAVIGGVPTTLERVVITDQSGGQLAETFVGPNGAPVSPSSYTIGSCGSGEPQTFGPVCWQDNAGPGVTNEGFIGLDSNGNPELHRLNGSVVPAGTYSIVICPGEFASEEILCDFGNASHQFVRRYSYNRANGMASQVPAPSNFELDGFTPYVVIGPVGVCSGDTSFVNDVILCDDNGSFIRKFVQAVNPDTGVGSIVSHADFDLAGDPYVTVGDVSFGCTSPTATVSAILECGDVGTEQFFDGANLLANGDLGRSSGTGAASSIGPGWTTDYAPCGPNIFAGPCGAATYAFFDTNAGSVTGGNATATMIEALSGRSMMVNVSGNLAAAIVRWDNIYLENGKTYTMSADAAEVFAPFDVAVKVDTGAIITVPLSSPPVGNWGKTTATFLWTGTTGYHSVGLYSNNGAAGGNDHAFDNFSLRRTVPAQTEVRMDIVYSGTQRAVIDQIVETAGCNDDRRDSLLGDIADAVGELKAERATIDSTAQRQTGAGAITIAAGARSVGIIVVAGTVTLSSIGQGAVVIPAGVTMNWSVDAEKEQLQDAFTFTGIAGSDFIVTSTRQ